MKFAWLIKLMPWRTIAAQDRLIASINAENTLLKTQRAELHRQVEELKTGNGIALSYIHKTHHLGAPFSEKALRDKMPQRKN